MGFAECAPIARRRRRMALDRSGGLAHHPGLPGGDAARGGAGRHRAASRASRGRARAVLGRRRWPRRLSRSGATRACCGTASRTPNDGWASWRAGARCDRTDAGSPFRPHVTLARARDRRRRHRCRRFPSRHCPSARRARRHDRRSCAAMSAMALPATRRWARFQLSARSRQAAARMSEPIAPIRPPHVAVIGEGDPRGPDATSPAGVGRGGRRAAGAQPARRSSPAGSAASCAPPPAERRRPAA